MSLLIGILTEDVSASPTNDSFEDHLFQVCIQLQYSGIININNNNTINNN